MNLIRFHPFHLFAIFSLDGGDDEKLLLRTGHGHVQKTDLFRIRLSSLFRFQKEEIMGLIFALPLRTITKTGHLSPLVQKDRRVISFPGSLKSAKKYIRKLQTLTLMDRHALHDILQRSRQFNIGSCFLL